MEAIRTSQVATFANGCLLGSDTIITYITTDSRDVREGCLFAAIKGDRFDGHSFINQAYAAGAACVLSQTEVSIPAGKSAIIVGDTRKALLNIAGGYRRMFNIPVVAITGSVGKTTTKDIVAEVLSKRFNVLKTIGNFNNDIGVPKTIFSLGIEHNAAVIEMGMNHKGEIDTLARSVSPDIGIITNVGVSHIENLGSREGILDAKCEMFSHIKPGGVAILNCDDEMLSTIRGNEKKYGIPKDAKVLWYGTDNECDIWAENIESLGIEGVNCTIHTPRGEIDVIIAVPGRHMVYNAMAATAVGIILKMDLYNIKQGIEGFEPTGMRMERVYLNNGAILIDDSYNANPVSTKAAIDVLASCSGKKCVILGDMFELGDFATNMHREVGMYAASKGIDEVIAIGEMSINIYNAAKETGMKKLSSFLTVDDFISSGFVPKGTVLIKASHSMQFGKIADYLKKF